MKHKRAFTLIELMIIIAIISVLAGMGVANYSSAIKKARDAKRKSDMSELQQALMMFRADHGSYPCHWGGSTDCKLDEGKPFKQVVAGSTDNNLHYIDIEGGDFALEPGYVRTMPIDTSRINDDDADQYTYTCQLRDTPGTRCVDFSMCAKLEDPASSGPNAKNAVGDECDPGVPPGPNCSFFCLRSP